MDRSRHKKRSFPLKILQKFEQIISFLGIGFLEIFKESIYKTKEGNERRWNICEHLEQYAEAVAQKSSVKKLLLKISQNSRKSTCARVSLLIKLQAWPATLLKKSLWHRYFPVNFAKILRTPFLKKHLRWLLLSVFLE